MSSPLVSAIVCNYNCAQYLGEAIESVLNQTFQDFELVVVDDGSTDSSKEVIERYQSLHPKKMVTIFKPNGGQASALNVAFEKSRGNIVSFLDSDDIWMATKLENVTKAFARQDFSVVQHNHQVIDSMSKMVDRIHPRVEANGDILRLYFAENRTGFFSSTSGISALRKFLKSVFPIDESWRICADVPLTRVLPVFGEVLTLPIPLGYYRIHSNNSWMNSEAQASWIENEIRYTEYVNKKLEEFGVKEKVDFRKSLAYKRWNIPLLPSAWIGRAVLRTGKKFKSMTDKVGSLLIRLW